MVKGGEWRGRQRSEACWGGHPGDPGASTASEDQSGQGHVTVGGDSELRGCPFRTRATGKDWIGKGFR